MTWADERVVFRAAWADGLRIIMDGVDVTFLRDVPAEWSSYQLQEPFEYGPASFRFPQVTDHELRTDSDDQAADLRWLRKGAPAAIVPVIDGEAQDPIWRGFISARNPRDGIVEVTCAGEASGRLALDLQPTPMFQRRVDVGRWVFEAFRDCYLRLTPRGGPTTGIELDARGSFEDRLTYVNGLLADAQELDGDQWTVRRHATKNAYEMVQKDTETVHCTIFAGTDVHPEFVDDLSEQPNSFYGMGINPNGMKWNGGVVPGIYTETLPYPMAAGADFGIGTDNADTLTGEGISIMHARLIGVGAMDRDDGSGTYDQETADAVELIQDRAGLPETGIMDTDTWDALFDVNASGFTLAGARVEPIAQNKQVRKWDLTAAGKIWRINPDWDPARVKVSRFVQNGKLRKRRYRRWARRQINLSAGKNWPGSIDLANIDVFAGDYEHGDPSPTLMSRFEIRAGMNLMFRGWDGDTLFHIAGVNVRPDGVSVIVDTQARDRRTLGEMIERNRASRISRGREWTMENRTSGQVHDVITGWFEHGGLLPQDFPVTANQWNVFRFVGGQEGLIAKFVLDIETAAYSGALFGAEVTPQWLETHIGDPFVVDEDGNPVWMTTSQQNFLFNQRRLLHAFGTTEEPGGYSPKRHTNPITGATTDAPITGVYRNSTGFQFRCFSDEPLIYAGIYPLQDGVVKSGRIAWEQIEDSI